jgi:hypothetical protein
MAMDDLKTTASTTGNEVFPEIMTSAQAMTFLQIGRTAFNKAVKAGAIPCWRINRKLIRFSREALNTVATMGTAAAVPGPPPLKNFELQQVPAIPAAIIPNSGNDHGRVPGTTMNREQRAEAKRIYLANVNSGQPLKEAAVEAGVTMGAVRNWRDSDKAFEAAESTVRT